MLVSIHSRLRFRLGLAFAVKDLCWCQSTASGLSNSESAKLSKICAGVNPQRNPRGGQARRCCQRSVLVSIHSRPSLRQKAAYAVKDLCWCQSTARSGGPAAPGRLSKICAGVNPQRWPSARPSRRCCQRSVLVSIHSGGGHHAYRMQAVKDLCWCQSTAENTAHRLVHQLSKICAGVNPQPCALCDTGGVGCQRSVLVSIHSMNPGRCLLLPAVKDLCWCQSTAQRALAVTDALLSKICAGVNPQLPQAERLVVASCQRSVLVSIHSVRSLVQRGELLSKICAGVNPQQQHEPRAAGIGCQRSVLVSIHSVEVHVVTHTWAVKDLCWCQSTACDCRCRRCSVLSKICAGVNPQRLGTLRSLTLGCQRSVLVSIHSMALICSPIHRAVKDLCWCQSTANEWRPCSQFELSKICAGVNPQRSSCCHS